MRTLRYTTSSPSWGTYWLVGMPGSKACADHACLRERLAALGRFRAFEWCYCPFKVLLEPNDDEFIRYNNIYFLLQAS